MKRAPAVVLLAFLLAPSVLAAPWTQAGGDQGRSGAWSEGTGRLDVAFVVPLDDLDLASPGTGLPFLPSPQGPLVLSNGQPCEAWRLPLAAAEAPEVVAEFACSGEPQAGAVMASLAFVCTYGDDGDDILRALDIATLDVRWSFAPSEATARTTLVYGGWYCGGMALDDGADLLVVPFRRGGDQNRLVAFQASTGDVLWSRVLASPRASPAYAPGGLLGTAQDTNPAPSFDPWSVTLTNEGILVSGQSLDTPGHIWLTRGGKLLGGVAAQTPVPASARLEVADSSRWAAARGVQAAFLLDDDVVVVAPPSGHAVVYSLERRVNGLAPGPVWTDAGLVVPTIAGLVALEPASFRPLWTWDAPFGAQVLDIVASPSGPVVAWHDDGSAIVYVSRFDVGTGREVHRLPVLASERPLDIRLMPYGDALLALSPGRATVLQGGARDIPTLSASTNFPALDSFVTVDWQPPAGRVVQAATLTWGDGAVDTLEAPGAVLAHQYTTPGPRVARLAALYDDGRTGTAELLLEVGAKPPPDLTLVQRAFTQERQESTFFLIGLAFTAGAALAASVVRSRRRARLSAEDRGLRAIVDDSMLNPVVGLAALELHRAHLRDAHMRRRLDDAQFGLLDHRTVRAMKSARYRLLGSALNKLSPHFRRLLDTALEDGQVTSGEMAALVDALSEESALSPAERERIQGLLRSWAT